MKMVPEKIAAFFSYCVSAFLMFVGGLTNWLHHVDWNQIAVIGGFLIGIATFLTSTYFDWRRTRAYEKGVDAGIIEQPPEKRGLFRTKGGE